MFQPMVVVGGEEGDALASNDSAFPASRAECNESIVANLAFAAEYDYLLYVQLCLTVVNAVVNAYGHFAILRRQDRRPALSFLLRGLSVCEVFFNLSFFTGTLLRLLLYTNRLRVPRDSPLLLLGLGWTFVGVNTLTVASHLMRNWTVVTIACFRMMAVARPVKFYRVFSRRVVTPVYLALLLLAVAMALPRLFEHRLVYCAEFTSVTWMKKALLQVKAYQLYYINVIFFLFQNGGPVLTVALVSIVTARAIYVQQKRRPGGHPPAPSLAESKNGSCRRSVKKERRKGSADRTVILLSILFFVCEIPTFFNKLFVLLQIPDAVDIVFSSIANIMVCVESFCNFIVYLVANGTINIATPAACSRALRRLLARHHRSQEAVSDGHAFTMAIHESDVEREQQNPILQNRDTAV